jgi:hypothetical protein
MDAFIALLAEALSTLSTAEVSIEILTFVTENFRAGQFLS